MSRRDGAGSGDYEVGKGRPPQQYRWKKGQSGNPRGRPKAAPPETLDVGKVLNGPVAARIQGKKTEATPYEVTVRQIARKAIDGHLPSIRQFLSLCESFGVIAPPKPAVGGGVVVAPAGVSPQEWLEEVGEWISVDDLKKRQAGDR